MDVDGTKKDGQKPSGMEGLIIARLSGRGEGIALPALVDELSRDLGRKRDEVIGGLMELQSSKAIVISESTPYASFARYAASPNSSWFWATAGAILASVVLVFATSGLALYLRYFFGSLLVLFIPGYSLIQLLYPKKELDELAKVALSIGLSLALVPLVGLVLNYTPLGIRLFPVAFSLSGLA